MVNGEWCDLLGAPYKVLEFLHVKPGKVRSKLLLVNAAGNIVAAHAPDATLGLSIRAHEAEEFAQRKPERKDLAGWRVY